MNRKELLKELAQIQNLLFLGILNILFFIGSFFYIKLVSLFIFFNALQYDIYLYNFTLCRHTIINPLGQIENPPLDAEMAYRYATVYIWPAVLTYEFRYFQYFYGFWEGIIAVLIFFIPFIFGAKDYLYYLFLNEELGDKWYWVYWTPWGWFRTFQQYFKYKKELYFNDTLKSYLNNVIEYTSERYKVFLYRREIIFQSFIGIFLMIGLVLYWIIK